MVLVKPNQTVLQCKVLSVRPQTDGWGVEVDLMVLKNESRNPEEDFLRPAEGAVVTAFSAEPEGLQEGQTVRVHARLAAGPRAGRVVLQSVDTLRATP